jgi:putative NADH-flavin reductase
LYGTEEVIAEHWKIVTAAFKASGGTVLTQEDLGPDDPLFNYRRDVMRGDLTDAGFLADTMRAADAVLSGLGLRMPGILPWHKPEDATFASRSAVAIVAAMQRAQVRRILAVSAGGVGDSFEAVPGVFRGMIRWTGLRHAYADLERMEKIYADSGLDWCAPRPTGLTDGPATGKVVIAPSFTGRATISRADVAGWMLDEVVRKTIKVRTPMITVTGAS